MIFRSGSLLGVPLMLVAGHAALAQPDSWEKTQALPAGAKVELLLAGEKTVEGTLSQVSSNDLTLTRKSGSIQLAKSDIRRVWVLGKGSRLKNAGIAALAGFAVGCTIGATQAGQISDMNNPGAGRRAGFCLGIGGFIGGSTAGIAAAIPATRRTLVYRATGGKR